MSVSFLHLADLHIGLRITRFDESVAKKLREARLLALDNALKIAREKNVAFILICGDLFDDNTISLVDAQRVYDMLKGKPMPVYVLPGNHDPYCAGSVWQRPPWGNTEGTSIRVLSKREPVALEIGVTLYPCPVMQKTSREDPTEWISANNGPQNTIRIGLAHGSVMDRETLPEDDHPIPVDAAESLGLDYLALGHWHAQKLFQDSRGANRMAYPGTHEQMNFGKGSGFSVGWAAYASDPDREEFRGSSKGRALLVQIQSLGAVPIVQPVETGQYIWSDEALELTDENFAATFTQIAQRKNQERQLLRLTLAGTLSAENRLKLEGFQDMLNRYLWHELDTDELGWNPTDEELEETVGHGVLGEVLRKIKGKLENEPTNDERLKIEKAIFVLYRLARELSP